MIKSQYITLLAATLLCSSLGAGAELNPDTQAAVSALFDPHAASDQKMSAIRFLINAQYEVDSRDGFHIHLALARQAHYDMFHVRDLARVALVQKLGSERADRFIAAYDPLNEAMYHDFSAALRAWKGIEGIPRALYFDAMNHNAEIHSIAEFAKIDPERLKSLNEPLKGRLVGHLERMDRINPKVREDTLLLVQQLGMGRPEAVPLILRSLASGRGNVRQMAEAFNITNPKLPQHKAIIAAIAAGMCDPDYGIADWAYRLLKNQPAEVRKPQAPIIADAVASAAAAEGNQRTVTYLASLDVEPSLFLKTVHARLVSARTDYQRLSLLNALFENHMADTLESAPQSLRLIATFLDHPAARIDLAAARLFTTPKSHALAVRALISSINAGKLISPEVLKTIKPDPQSFTAGLIDSVRSDNPTICRAAVKALAITGVEGEAIRPALQPLLRSRDGEIRHAAADILNTPEALARARLPDLFDEIRSMELSTRQRAALQIDELNLEPREMTAALVKTVKEGNFPARQGLLAALEEANFAGKNPIYLIKQSASPDNADAAQRAFARAALREIDAAKARKEIKR